MKLNRLVANVSGEALAGEGVVLVSLLVTVREVNHLQIIRIGCIMWDKVDEDGFFFTLAVQEQLNVLVQVTPFLGLLRLLRILAGQVCDNVRLDGLLLVSLLEAALRLATRLLTIKRLKLHACSLS